jgi:hypothetical protein
MPGLNRADIVFLNRMQVEYTNDKLPNTEQIRYDFARMIGVVTRLNDEIEKLTRMKT